MRPLLPKGAHAVTDDSVPSEPNCQYRHPVPVRIWHWLSACAVLMLLFTGFNILNVHPRFYWGEVGNESTEPAVGLVSTAPGGPNPALHPSPAALKVGSHTWNVTGVLGAALDFGADGMYFVIAPTPDSWHFGAMRGWHFFWAWVLVLGWLAYALYTTIGGRLRHVLWLDRNQRSWRALARDLGDHLRLRRASGDAQRQYNPLQKIAYLAVLFVLLPLAIATGMTMSNAITARFPELYLLFGGRQSARTLHGLCALLLVLFILVHVAQVFVAGVINELRSMITGYFRIRTRSKS